MYKFSSPKKGDYIESRFISIAHGLRSKMFGHSKDVVRYVNENGETIYIPSDFHACYQPDLNNPLELECSLVNEIEDEKYLQWPHLIRLNKREDFCANECLSIQSNSSSQIKEWIENLTNGNNINLNEYIESQENDLNKRILENLIQSHMNQFIYNLISTNKNSKYEIYRIIMKLEIENQIPYNPFNRNDMETLLKDVNMKLQQKISWKDRLNIFKIAKNISRKVKSEITNLSDIISFSLSSLWISGESLKNNKSKFISTIRNLKSFFLQSSSSIHQTSPPLPKYIHVVSPTPPPQPPPPKYNPTNKKRIEKERVYNLNEPNVGLEKFQSFIVELNIPQENYPKDSQSMLHFHNRYLTYLKLDLRNIIFFPVVIDNGFILCSFNMLAAVEYNQNEMECEIKLYKPPDVIMKHIKIHINNIPDLKTIFKFIEDGIKEYEDVKTIVKQRNIIIKPTYVGKDNFKDQFKNVICSLISINYLQLPLLLPEHNYERGFKDNDIFFDPHDQDIGKYLKKNMDQFIYFEYNYFDGISLRYSTILDKRYFISLTNDGSIQNFPPNNDFLKSFTLLTPSTSLFLKEIIFPLTYLYPVFFNQNTGEYIYEEDYENRQTIERKLSKIETDINKIDEDSFFRKEYGQEIVEKIMNIYKETFVGEKFNIFLSNLDDIKRRRYFQSNVFSEEDELRKRKKSGDRYSNDELHRFNEGNKQRMYKIFEDISQSTSYRPKKKSEEELRQESNKAFEEFLKNMAERQKKSQEEFQKNRSTRLKEGYQKYQQNWDKEQMDELRRQFEKDYKPKQEEEQRKQEEWRKQKEEWRKQREEWRKQEQERLKREREEKQKQEQEEKERQKQERKEDKKSTPPRGKQKEELNFELISEKNCVETMKRLESNYGDVLGYKYDEKLEFPKRLRFAILKFHPDKVSAAIHFNPNLNITADDATKITKYLNSCKENYKSV